MSEVTTKSPRGLKKPIMPGAAPTPNEKPAAVRVKPLPRGVTVKQPK